MSQHAQKALEWSFLLEAGLVVSQEVIEWADRLLEDPDDYDDAIAEISMAATANTSALISKLGAVPGITDRWIALRKVFGRMSGILTTSPERAEEFIRFLKQIRSRYGYNFPSDLNFVINVPEDYDLARDGMWGTIEEAKAELRKALTPFHD